MAHLRMELEQLKEATNDADFPLNVSPRVRSERSAERANEQRADPTAPQQVERQAADSSTDSHACPLPTAMGEGIVSAAEGWLAGAKGRSCTCACAAKGLRCTEAAQHAHNSEVRARSRALSPSKPSSNPTLHTAHLLSVCPLTTRATPFLRGAALTEPRDASENVSCLCRRGPCVYANLCGARRRLTVRTTSMLCL
jgi:hypothetical protein